MKGREIMKKIILKKITSIVLVAALLCNVCSANVNAETMLTATETTVYVDGVEFKVSINDDLEIEVEGCTDNCEALLVIDKDGNGEVNIEDKEAVSEEYDLDINELSKYDADVDVYEDGKKIDEITSVDEIVEDKYEGQTAIAISAGGVVISIGMLLEAMLNALLAVVIAGVLYIVVTKLYSKVEAATKTKKEKAKKYYYKAAVWKGQVVVSPVGITKSKAVSRVKNNLSIYSFTSTMARAAITQAGYCCSVSEIDKKRYKGHIYLRHYHKANKMGKVLHTGGFHSFYGAPVKGTL